MGKQYQILARKYRPQKFIDVVGQENVLTTLKNALRFEQAAHAYLFCGCRGVGKTTLARLFAKALNCLERGPDFEPCNHCSSCLDIKSGQSLDVIEIDGASNRGIDDIRRLNETVGYVPTHGKYKIYIIDEVHMLTKEAFNALLKTLEEPPEKTKFFFATTEPHKVLPTIISRCQRFDLLRLDSKQICDKLAHIATDMQREVEPEALQLIASFADGSLRDAESLFDQILCFSPKAVSLATVRDVLGLVSEEYFTTLDQAFTESRLAYAFELVENLFQAGKDLNHFLRQLVDHYRSICLCKTVPEQALPDYVTKRYKAASTGYTQAQALYILDLLMNAEQTMQKSAFPRVTLESTLLHLIRSKHRIPIEAIAKRLHALEEALAVAESTAPPVAPAPVSVFTESKPPEIPHANDLKNQDFSKEVPQNFLSAAEPLVRTQDANVEKNLELQCAQTENSSLSSVSIKEIPPTQAPSVFASQPRETLPDSSSEKKTFCAPSVFASPQNTEKTAPKHKSHYETMLRFAAIELEGTLKEL